MEAVSEKSLNLTKQPLNSKSPCFHGAASGELQPGLRLPPRQDELCNVLAEGRSEFEPVPRTPADEPHVRCLRVAVDDQVLVEVSSYWQTRVSRIGAFARSGMRTRRPSRIISMSAGVGVRSPPVGSNGSPRVSSPTLTSRRSLPGMP